MIKTNLTVLLVFLIGFILIGLNGCASIITEDNPYNKLTDKQITIIDNGIKLPPHITNLNQLQINGSYK